MTNHPNRSQKTPYIVLKGDTMRGGYIADNGAKTLAVIMVDGAAYEYDRDNMQAMTWELPLVLDAEGEITRTGARSGYGFLPDAGEIERAATRRIVFAQ